MYQGCVRKRLVWQWPAVAGSAMLLRLRPALPDNSPDSIADCRDSSAPEQGWVRKRQRSHEPALDRAVLLPRSRPALPCAARSLTAAVRDLAVFGRGLVRRWPGFVWQIVV